jgi:hypothetical protein
MTPLAQGPSETSEQATPAVEVASSLTSAPGETKLEEKRSELDKMLEEEHPPENVSHEKPEAQAEETEKSSSVGGGLAEDASIAEQEPEVEPGEGKE